MLKIRTNKSKFILLFSGILLLVLLNSNNFRHNLLTNDNAYNNSETSLKNAGYWVVSPFSIDGNSGWETANSTYDWITGSGTWSDPYVIENISIDAEYSGNCIEIRNSDVYFIIRNCTLYNAGYTEFDSGIYLGCSNGLITLNNCSNNLWNGIYVGGNDNTISMNLVMNNGYSGIRLSSVLNSLISKNIAFGNGDNDDMDIYMWHSDDNIISENIVSGIFIFVSNNNTYSSNYNDGRVMLSMSNENILWNNTLIGNNRIRLTDDCYVNLIYQNYFKGTSSGSDDGMLNKWDNGTIGNYWNDYNGVDADDNGIGDTPYNITGTAESQDNYPIWDDGHNGNPILIDDAGVFNWTWAKSKTWCSGDGTWSNPYIIENVTIDAEYGGSCIEIKNSDAYFIIRNCTVYNSGFDFNEAGIYLYYVKNGMLINNDCSNNGGSGIEIEWSDNNTIVGNTADNNIAYGLLISGGANNSALRNEANTNEVGIGVSGNNNNISKNTINGNNYGIDISGQKNLVSGNIVNNTDYYGIYIGGSYHTILNNTVNNSADGIALVSSDDGCRVLGNKVTNNWNNGILLSYSNNHTISGNIVYSGSMGISLHESHINKIWANFVGENGINAEDDGVGNQWDNGTIGNYWSDYSGVDADDDGIGDNPYDISGSAGSTDNYPIWDDGFNGDPIFIDGQASGVGAHNWTWAQSRIWCSGSGTWSNPYIIENVTIDAEYSGSCIEIRWSDVYFIIRNCTLYNSGFDFVDAGIYMFFVHNGSITLNNCSNNLNYGIHLETLCLNNTISKNIIMNNKINGIKLRSSFNNLISKNNFSSENENQKNNIEFSGSDNNTISMNKFSNQYIDYIHLTSNSDNNTVSCNYLFRGQITLFESHENILWNNTIIFGAIVISFNAHLNLAYQNYFRNWPSGAIDLGNLNKWDNGSIGNYWWNYTGKDIDDDGIGDTPFIIIDSVNSQDKFPIWWDAPIINITVPHKNNIFELSPFFEVSMVEGIANTTWYTLDNGLTNITFTGLTGKIDKTEWDQRVDGLVTIKFFANDSRGYMDFEEVSVFKETSLPNITINAPTLNEVFEFIAPKFNITIDDRSPINTTWYTIDGGLTNYTFSELNDFINQTAWDQKEDGVITIKFYANDSLGNEGFKAINIIKDTAHPVIAIISPNNNELLGTTTPNFNVEIFDANLNSMWYTLDNGLTNITFTENGTINQSAWDTLPNGTVSILFYANDSAGKIDFSSVTVRVDKILPIIVINSPNPNELFETTAPSFSVEISDTNLDTMWYTIDDGITKHFFLTNSSLNLAAWSALSDGVIDIQFYANDTAGNIKIAEVTIRKDVNAPIISINNPQNSDVIGATAPNFDISIQESNLDKTWYSINGGSNITFTGLTGTINQALWDALPEGNVIIRFYANDTLGRIGFQEVTVVKTISQPSPLEIPGYEILLLLGIVSTIAIIIVKIRLNRLK